MGIIQNLKDWNKQRKMNKIAKLMREVVTQPIGTRGTNEHGTVMIVKDIYFDVRKNEIKYNYNKIQRGIQKRVSKPKK